MFKARFLSWSSLTNIPDSSKSVLLRLLDNASGAEEGSSISSQEGSIPALLNELALMVVSLLHRTAASFGIEGAALGRSDARYSFRK